MSDSVVRVLLVDYHELIRKGLANSFGLRPVTEVGSAAVAVAEAFDVF